MSVFPNLSIVTNPFEEIVSRADLKQNFALDSMNKPLILMLQLFN